MITSVISKVKSLDVRILINNITQSNWITANFCERICSISVHSVTVTMSPPLTEFVTLHNGVQMPLLGFGTYRLKKEGVEDPIRFALGAG